MKVRDEGSAKSDRTGCITLRTSHVTGTTRLPDMEPPMIPFRDEHEVDAFFATINLGTPVKVETPETTEVLEEATPCLLFNADEEDPEMTNPGWPTFDIRGNPITPSPRASSRYSSPPYDPEAAWQEYLRREQLDPLTLEPLVPMRTMAELVAAMDRLHGGSDGYESDTHESEGERMLDVRQGESDEDETYLVTRSGHRYIRDW